MLPLWTPEISWQTWPNEWNSGSVISETTGSCRLVRHGTTRMSEQLAALSTRLRCVSSAPFGWPVVPDV